MTYYSRMISVPLTFEVRRLDGLGGVDESALVGPARQVAEVLPEVGQARRAARQHRLGQVEVLLHVGDLDGASGLVIQCSCLSCSLFGPGKRNIQSWSDKNYFGLNDFKPRDNFLLFF